MSGAGPAAAGPAPGRPALSTILLLAAGLVLVVWNGSRFIGAVPKTRTKDLDFLPSPAVAKALALGHRNTVAKLRWIDSFAYFELQLERKDDSVAATGESAFERLYRMLIALDPHFVPFYENASLNLGGVLDHHMAVLSVLQQGLLDLPHETRLWRMIATELRVTYQAEERNPNAIDQLLAAWSAAELDEAGRQQVWDWKKAMGRRVYKDLRQLSYWQEQLRVATPGTPTYTFVVDTMREQVARFGENFLDGLIAARAKTTAAPLLRLDGLLDPGLLRSALPDGVPPSGPLVEVDGVVGLRPDPFGYPYSLVDGHAKSPGWEGLLARRRGSVMTERLEELAKRGGRWPATLEAAVAAGLQLDDLPDHCRWKLVDQHIEAEVDPPPFPAWDPSPKKSLAP